MTAVHMHLDLHFFLLFSFAGPFAALRRHAAAFPLRTTMGYWSLDKACLAYLLLFLLFSLSYNGIRTVSVSNRLSLTYLYEDQQVN